MSNFIRISLLAGILVIAYSCATPTSPTGGPADKEGPEIVRTEPETGTVNFDRQSITIHFSEFVERRSLNNAMTIEPGVGIEYSFDWGRKSVEIEFDSELPELTTVIITIGTELRDVNGNQIGKPFKIAVSTGPEIDKGRLYGKVVDAQTGRGQQDKRILLYRAPVDLTRKADYIAGTDTSGAFQFAYLREGKYKAFWLEDRNRNRIWDREQERAQPFGKEFVELKKAASDTLGTVYIASADTSRPSLQGIGLFSSRRLRMRFSEDIKLTDNTRVTISDTLGNSYSSAYPLYIPSSEPFVLFAHSEKELQENRSYNLNVENISDITGNNQQSTTLDFTGTAQEDTTLQRIITRRNRLGIFPDEPVEMIYATPISSSVLRDSIKVVEGTTLRENWTNVNINRNKLQVMPEGEWKSGVDYEVRVWDPAIESYKKIEPTIWHSKFQGALHIILDDTANTEAITTRVSTTERGVMADTTFETAVEITDLPPINYKVTLFKDLNGNGKWDFGNVVPYRAPEPYYIRTRVPVKKSFTSDLNVSLRN